MKSVQKLYLLAAAAGVAFSGSAAEAQVQSSFQRSCININVHGSTLSATCRRVDGSMNRTSLQIDGVENINGKLQYTGASPSSYQQTCRDIGADGDTLFATCRQVDGSYQRTSMPIPGIENNNGNLRHL